MSVVKLDAKKSNRKASKAPKQSLLTAGTRLFRINQTLCSLSGRNLIGFLEVYLVPASIETVQPTFGPNMNLVQAGDLTLQS